jgi:hypothetical protein
MLAAKKLALIRTGPEHGNVRNPETFETPLAPPGAPLRVVMYTRVSTSEQVDSGAGLVVAGELRT